MPRRKSVSPKELKTLVRIVGRPPLQATVFEMERLRCNTCGEIFRASEPQSAGPEKFDASSMAMTALVKYGAGMPFNRPEHLEKQLGIPLPASTQWELVKRAAGLLRPVLNELIRQAAQGSVMHNDDTSMRILKLAGLLSDPEGDSLWMWPQTFPEESICAGDLGQGLPRRWSGRGAAVVVGKSAPAPSGAQCPLIPGAIAHNEVRRDTPVLRRWAGLSNALDHATPTGRVTQFEQQAPYLRPRVVVQPNR